MSDQIGIRDYLTSRFNAIDDRLSHIESHLGTQNGRLRKLEEENAKYCGTISAFKWIAGSGGLLGLLGFIRGLLK